MTLRVGQEIGSYRVIQEIACGQYACIYKASHVILTNRIVALKLLYTIKLSSAQDAEQYFHEARILERLQHPHILPVLDTNIYEHSPYSVMEFAVNGSLRERLRRARGKPLPLDEALAILQQIGEGLQFAHEQNVVHSDIKPENILFTAGNVLRISDFDIARILNRSNAQAASGGGTPSYMAPEQFQGKVRKESDQYALGCIAYELLTGRRPFTGSDLEALMQAHLHEEPVPPTQLNPALPLHIEQAILRALAKKYTERYERVAGFIQALTLAQQQGPGHGAPAPAQRPRETRLILKDRQHAKGDDEFYYEKTVLEAEPAQPDPHAEVTVAHERAQKKRQTVTKRKPAPKVQKAASTEKKATAEKTKEVVRERASATGQARSTTAEHTRDVIEQVRARHTATTAGSETTPKKSTPEEDKKRPVRARKTLPEHAKETSGAKKAAQPAAKPVAKKKTEQVEKGERRKSVGERESVPRRRPAPKSAQK